MGGPIGSYDYCNAHTLKRVNKACDLLKALWELPDPQVALKLLRQCASFCKLVFSQRVVPHRVHKVALRSFDQAARDCVDSCCSFSPTMNGRLLPWRPDKVVLASGLPNTTVQPHSSHLNFLVTSTAQKSILNLFMTLAIRSRVPSPLAKTSTPESSKQIT